MKIQSNFFDGERFVPFDYFLLKGLYPNKFIFSLNYSSSSNKLFELFNDYFSDYEIKYSKLFHKSENYYNNIYVIKEDKTSPVIIEYNNLTKNVILYSMNNELEDTLHKIIEICNENKS